MATVLDAAGNVQCQVCQEWTPQGSVFCQICGQRLSVPSAEGTNTKRSWVNPTPVSLQGAAWDKAVRENTDRFWKALNLPTFEQMNNPKLIATAVKQRNVTLFGTPESGKSTRLYSFAAHLQEMYGRKNVAIQIVKAKDFRTVLDAPRWERRMVHFLALEDCTNRRFTEEELEEFWQLRHTMQEKTGLARGLLVLCFTAHSFFRLQKELRTDPKAVLLLDVPENPLNPADTRVSQDIIPDEDARKWLREKEKAAMDDPDMLGYAWALIDGNPAGFIYLPVAEAPKERGWQIHFPSLRLHRSQEKTLKATKPAPPQISSDRSFLWGGLLLLLMGILILTLVWIFR